MRTEYKKWLEDQKYSAGTVTTQLHRAGRVEDCYGDLEQHLKENRLQEILEELTYSTTDERQNKPNPSKIPFQGKIRTNLASYKDALKRYQIFLNGNWPVDTNISTGDLNVPPVNDVLPTILTEAASQKLSLERDMQAALRLNIKELGVSLSIFDDGAERSVESGFIDILCEDRNDGALVVVELKAGKTDSRVIGQILGYMGDIGLEEPERNVRGILVAQDFDQRTISASRAVSNLSLMKYAIEFKFEKQS